MKVLQFPLSRITIAFVFGIIVSSYSKINPTATFIGLLLCFTALLATYFISRKKHILPIYFGALALLLSFLVGATCHIVQSDAYKKSNYTHRIAIFDKPHLFTMTLREKLKSNSYSDRYIANLNSVNQTKTSGKIILNIEKGPSLHRFAIGDILQTTATLSKNTFPKNPNQFDYSKYLENKQVFAQLYSEINEIKISDKKDKSVWYYTSKLRSVIIENLERSGFNQKELNVAIALILGQQQDISADIIRDYQFAGAVHILSVSGLHIGFILLFVTFMLKPIPNNKRGSIIKLITILISLWSFGLIAGLAPSVVRSVTMFSFVAIGNHLRRSVNIYHTLLVSVLLILFFQPSFLFDVGFQLSYIALFFILWLQPLLAEIWKPKNKITKYIWDILTVSFAAQIGTLPLSIYYFHQFPGLFFITNLLVIPLLVLVMVLGVLVMVLAAFGFVPYILSRPLEWSIYYLNKIINYIASIEQFIFKDISFNSPLLLSSYIVIISTIIWLEKPTFKKVVITLITVIFFQLSFLQTYYKVERQEEWTIFNLKKKTIITERKGTSVHLYSNDSINHNSKASAILNSYLVGNFSKIQAKSKLPNLSFFNGRKIIIIDSSGVYPPSINPDVVILTNSPKINLERLLKALKPNIIVADASNYKSIQKGWEATCRKQKIPFHATAEKGFYRLY